MYESNKAYISQTRQDLEQRLSKTSACLVCFDQSFHLGNNLRIMFQPYEALVLAKETWGLIYQVEHGMVCF